MPAELDVVKTLQQLIQIPSVNPMGLPVQGDIYLEHRLTDHLESIFQDWKLEYQRTPVLPNRDNVFAYLPGKSDPLQGGQLLMLEVHQDTVPVEGMTIDPFAAAIKDDKIFGRGACDIKGGMAVYLALISYLLNTPQAERPAIMLACSVNEEHGFHGATHLANSWKANPQTIFERKPDAIIVAEPTMLDVVTTHKGVIRWRCQTIGKAAHSSDPTQGDNAIYRMAQVVQHLQTYAEEELPKRDSYPKLGKPTLSVGTINGGVSVNTVPDACEIQIDLRINPGQTPEAEKEKVIQYLAEKLNDVSHLQHTNSELVLPGLSHEKNQDLAQHLISAVKETGRDSQAIGVAYGTDAPPYDAQDVPTVVFGPGSIHQAHTKDEWVAIDQLHAALEVLKGFCAKA